VIFSVFEDGTFEQQSSVSKGFCELGSVTVSQVSRLLIQQAVGSCCS
jgi:hypothetical protein